MAPATPQEPHEILGVSRGANEKEIRAAYRRLAAVNHPDLVQGEVAKRERTEKLAEISAARDALLDPSNEATAEVRDKRRPRDPFTEMYGSTSKGSHSPWGKW